MFGYHLYHMDYMVFVQKLERDSSIRCSGVVWEMIYVYFCGIWCHYAFFSWFPTYLSEELHLKLTNAASVSILPLLGSILVSRIATPFADT